MKINAAYVLKNLNGSPILEGKEPVTLKQVVVTGLVDQSNDSTEIKQKKFKLAQRIFQAESIFEVSLEEAKIKFLALKEENIKKGWEKVN